MRFFKKIQNNLASQIITRKLKNSPRKKEFHNLESAKSIGIFFDTQNMQNYHSAKKFSNDLLKRGFQVDAVGWINEKDLPDFAIAQKILFYTKKDIKWTGQPTSRQLLEFTDKRYDLLFVLTTSNHITVKYITRLSKAACKIGAPSENKDYLDFIINQDNIQSESLIKESVHYLTEIKKS